MTASTPTTSTNATICKAKATRATNVMLVAILLLLLTTPSLGFSPSFSSHYLVSKEGTTSTRLSVATTPPMGDGNSMTATVRATVPSATQQAQQSQSTSVSSSSVLPWDYQQVVQRIWQMDDQQRPVIMFDGDCNLCNGGVNMLLDMDTANHFRFCSLSSKFGQSLLVAHGCEPDDNDSIRVILPSNANGNNQVASYCLHKSEAVMEICQNLQGAPAWVKAITAVGTVAPAHLSDWLLHIIADNRHQLAGGEYDQCRLDLDGEYEGRFLNDWEHEDLFTPLKPERGSDIIFS